MVDMDPILLFLFVAFGCLVATMVLPSLICKFMAALRGRERVGPVDLENPSETLMCKHRRRRSVCEECDPRAHNHHEDACQGNSDAVALAEPPADGRPGKLPPLGAEFGDAAPTASFFRGRSRSPLKGSQTDQDPVFRSAPCDNQHAVSTSEDFETKPEFRETAVNSPEEHSPNHSSTNSLRRKAEGLKAETTRAEADRLRKLKMVKPRVFGG
eukprot:TRINITY_DN29015_c0_g1_i3.p1 TRINITY_DN29015_c0_g1~~TRINITY_DN29015_c0_g1_i3.p1  ORF type:complete len:213 (-),score=0.37 TRINITY_DN29015_c0_g1_i3:24-662(-)